MALQIFSEEGNASSVLNLRIKHNAFWWVTPDVNITWTPLRTWIITKIPNSSWVCEMFHRPRSIISIHLETRGLWLSSSSCAEKLLWLTTCEAGCCWKIVYSAHLLWINKSNHGEYRNTGKVVQNEKWFLAVFHPLASTHGDETTWREEAEIEPAGCDYFNDHANPARSFW